MKGRPLDRGEIAEMHECRESGFSERGTVRQSICDKISKRKVSIAHSYALTENPALANWLFFHKYASPTSRLSMSVPLYTSIGCEHVETGTPHSAPPPPMSHTKVHP